MLSNAEIKSLPPQFIKPGESGKFPTINTIDTRQADLEALRARLRRRHFPQEAELGTIAYWPVGSNENGQVVYWDIHYLPEPLHRELMRSSAWHLIPPEVQPLIENIHLMAVGLSVGSNLVDQASRIGISSFAIADKDTADTAGSQRTVYEITDSGVNKSLALRRRLLMRNPYAQVVTYPEGLTPDNLNDFFTVPQGMLGLVVEETDHPWAKITTAETAKTRKLPVVMIGDVGRVNITWTFTAPGEPEFGNRTKGIDSDKNLLSFLLATLDNRIGSDLQGFLDSGLIGPDGEITRVPQDPAAAALAAVCFAAILPSIATGQYDHIPRIAQVNLPKILLA